MPPPRRRLVPRRRRADEGEDESSVAGDVEEDSLSEGSAASLADDDGDAEVSDGSLDDEGGNTTEPQPKSPTTNIKHPSVHKQANKGAEEIKGPATAFATSAENHVILNGLQGSATDVAELHFDDATSEAADPDRNPAASADPQLNAPKAPRNETPAQRSRREHQEYLRQRDSNPAFVPNRGGFFLHDDRQSSVSSFSGRPAFRGRGRGYDAPTHGPRLPFSESTDKQWAHDLHEPHEILQMPGPTPAESAATYQPKGAAINSSGPKAPNREFSFSTVLGNVTVHVSLPGVTDKGVVSTVAKKQHTLLPHHRPPLRRDKPVRISIPDDDPRYIFPSAERSFIFIPRALRPNQQSHFRGRGRGSFHGSRRTSVFGGSTYTPSVAMSRKSSYGGVARDSVRSPTGSTTSRPLMMGMDGSKPIVRLPSAGMLPPMHLPELPAMHPFPPGMNQANGAMTYGVPSALPMHQPRPQKTVSVADIESPASLSIKGPQQQEEQPFHQQVPAYMASSQDQQQFGSVSGAGGTPMSHIPEGAVYAQAFQPYPYMQPPVMYGPAYATAPTMYPQMSNGIHYPGPLPSMTVGSNYTAPSMHPQHSNPVSGAPGMMLQESNGMVYYYNPSSITGTGQHEVYPMMPMPTMMNPQAPYYYPV